MDAASAMRWVTLRRSRVRESRTPGSGRAKAEWLSYSTTIRTKTGAPLELPITWQLSAILERRWKESGTLSEGRGCRSDLIGFSIRETTSGPAVRSG